MNKRITNILLYAFCGISFILQIIFAYTFGYSAYQTKYIATLMGLDASQKNEGNDYTRCSFVDTDGEFMVSEGLKTLTRFYHRYQVFSHYLVAGPHEALSYDNFSIYCPEIDDNTEGLKINTYNDTDYIYEIPLPLHKYYVNEYGVPDINPVRAERPMFVDYGAQYTTYVSSQFADRMIERFANYKTYDDLIGKKYNLVIKSKQSQKVITCSINNIFLANDTDNWTNPNKKEFVDSHFGFPYLLGNIHKNGVFFASSDIFTEFGFWYEADIRTTYGNYDFYVNKVAKASIVEKTNLKIEFLMKNSFSEEEWVDYKDFSNLLRVDESKNNYLMLALSITFGVLFLGSYLLIWLNFKNDLFSFYKNRWFLLFLPVVTFIIFQLLSLIILSGDKYNYHLINNFLGNLIIVITLTQTVSMYLIATIVFSKKGKKNGKEVA